MQLPAGDLFQTAAKSLLLEYWEAGWRFVQNCQKAAEEGGWKEVERGCGSVPVAFEQGPRLARKENEALGSLAVLRPKRVERRLYAARTEGR